MVGFGKSFEGRATGVSYGLNYTQRKSKEVGIKNDFKFFAI